MKNLSREERGRVAEKLMELGNLIFIGLIITQLVPEIKLKLVQVAFGSLAIIASYIVAVWLMKGGGRR